MNQRHLLNRKEQVTPFFLCLRRTTAHVFGRVRSNNVVSSCCRVNRKGPQFVNLLWNMPKSIKTIFVGRYKSPESIM